MTTLTALPLVRRTAIGLSSTAQGADGTNELVRTARAALLACPWSPHPAAPSLPVHAYARPAPSGDAYAACYGYDAATRTQRAALGAVAYTYELPADAYSGTPADIASVRLSLTGDRYLADGVDLYVYASSDARPYSVAAQPSSALVGTYCATSGQSAPPNDRVGVTAAVEAVLGTRAYRYLHVVLLLHDYTATRGAWIEGGAMLDGAAAALDMSRDVAPDAPSPTLLRPIYSATAPADGYPHLTRPWAMTIRPTDSLPAALGTIADGRAALAAEQLGAGADTAWGWRMLSTDYSSAFCAAAPGSTTTGIYGTSPVYDASDLRAGRTISLPLASTSGSLRVRAVLVDLPSASGSVDWSDATLLSGSASACLGSVEFDAAQGASGTASLALHRTPDTPYVALLLYPVQSAATGGQYDLPATIPVA